MPRVRGWICLTAAILSTGILPGVGSSIIGGKSIDIRTSPWTVVIRYLGSVKCTGVIVGRQRVLTASHCVHNDSGTSLLGAAGFTVEAGVSNFNHLVAGDGKQVRRVSSLRAMGGFIPTGRLTTVNLDRSVEADLAVLTLREPLTMNSSDVRAIHLPPLHAKEPSSPVDVTIVGFGEEHGTGSTYPNGGLNKMTAQLDDACTTSRVLCVYSQTSTTCFGDSGAGLVTSSPIPILVGLVSLGGPNCQDASIGAIYMGAPDVLYFLSR